MKFAFGVASRRRLSTCDVQLQWLMEEVMRKQLMDFSILKGHRPEAEQRTAFAEGKSKVDWPNSRHNSIPAQAVDVAPYPIRWGNVGEPDRLKAIGAFYKLAGIVLATSRELNIVVRWGGDWNMNGDIFDQKWDDLPHFELWPAR